MSDLPDPAPARMPSNPPKYSLKKERHSSTIRIGDWTITATRRPILNGKEIEAAEKSLNLPLPEMTFGNNSLSLSYAPSSSTSSSTSTTQPVSSRIEMRFSTLDALAEVAVGEGWEERVGGGVKVSMAEAWGKSRASPSLLSDTPLPSKPVKPHDWTYATTYAGSLSGPSSFQSSPTHSIPMTLLSRQDPILDQILFYEDVPLFEDELHDNGESILNVRIRVMPHSFFILSRLFVRVDNVLFRIYDVRIYHAFGSEELVREVSGLEAGYEDVKRVRPNKPYAVQLMDLGEQRLAKQSDLSPLTSSNFVHGVMTSMTGEDGRPKLPHRTTGKAWPGLEKRVDVLRIPVGPGDADGAADGLEKLLI